MPLASKSVIDVDRKPSGIIVDEAADHEETEDDDGGCDTDDEIARMREKIEGARGDEHSKAALAKRMKKPAVSLIKRPVASIVKRPACAAGGPAQPALKSRFDAIGYKGCRIYWGGDRVYRVLTAPKTATVNLTWVTEEEAPKVWAKVLACCERHAR